MKWLGHIWCHWGLGKRNLATKQGLSEGYLSFKAVQIFTLVTHVSPSLEIDRGEGVNKNMQKLPVT